MLLTTEVVEDVFMAATILRWYTYRWRVEDYHKILKSGCRSERYRLALLFPLSLKSLHRERQGAGGRRQKGEIKTLTFEE